MRPERIEPGPDQESVWDYPRPPAVEPTESLVTVSFNETAIAESRRCVRLLETSQPPAFYIPKDDIDFAVLTPSIARTFCEWKGEASFFDLEVGDARIDQVGWIYPHPTKAYSAIADHVAFYAQKLDCTVDGEAVQPNEGSFYGGWITSKVVGPFKGGPGTSFW